MTIIEPSNDVQRRRPRSRHSPFGVKSRRRRDRGWCSPSERTDIELASKLFRSLGDPMPLAIIEILADGEHRVIDLVHRLDSSQPNVSGHLACLKECGLVTDRPEGRAVRYRLAHDELFDLLRAGETLLSRTGDDIALCPNLVSNPHGAVPSERTDP